MNLVNHKASRIAAAFVVVLVLAAVAGCQQTDVEQSAAVEETKSKDAPATADSTDDGAEARAGGGTAVAKAGGAEARAGDGKARAAAGVDGSGKKDKNKMKDKNEVSDNGPGEVRVKINGEPGTRFSGACVVGGEEREVSGQVPGRFVYEPHGRKVECEIRREGTGAGTLKFSVDAGKGNSKQKIKATADKMEFSVSGDSVSYSTSSTSTASSSSNSVVQNSSVNSSSYSSSSSSSSSP